MEQNFLTHRAGPTFLPTGLHDILYRRRSRDCHWAAAEAIVIVPQGPGLDGLAWVVVQRPLRVVLALGRPGTSLGLATRDFGIGMSGLLLEMGINATNKP